MLIGLPIAHCKASPFRSGYERALPRAKPDEYGLSRAVAVRLQQLLELRGFDTLLIEKEWMGRISPVRYRGAHAAQIEDLVEAGVDLALEVHINRSPAGHSGCLALCSGNSLMAATVARTWLEHYSALSHIKSYGVWSGAAAKETFGRKALLEDGPPSIIFEAGNVQSATDAAYLSQPHASIHISDTAARALQEVLTHGLDS